MAKIALFTYSGTDDPVTQMYRFFLERLGYKVSSAPVYNPPGQFDAPDAPKPEDITALCFRLMKGNIVPDLCMIIDPSSTRQHVTLVQEMAAHQEKRAERSRGKIAALMGGLPDALAGLKTKSEPGEVAYDAEKIKVEKVMKPLAEEALAKIDENLRNAKQAAEDWILSHPPTERPLRFIEYLRALPEPWKNIPVAAAAVHPDRVEQFLNAGADGVKSSAQMVHAKEGFQDALTNLITTSVCLREMITSGAISEQQAKARSLGQLAQTNREDPDKNKREGK